MITASILFRRVDATRPKLCGTASGRNYSAAFARAARQAGLYAKRGPNGCLVVAYSHPVPAKGWEYEVMGEYYAGTVEGRRL